MNSNHRSLARKEPVSVGKANCGFETGFQSRGTDGSNPSPSREESCANPVLPAQGACLRANARTKVVSHYAQEPSDREQDAQGLLAIRLRRRFCSIPPHLTLRNRNTATPEETRGLGGWPTRNIIRHVAPHVAVSVAEPRALSR